jgi:hypothetical protein
MGKVLWKPTLVRWAKRSAGELVEDRGSKKQACLRVKKGSFVRRSEKVRHNIGDIICLVTTTSEQRAKTLGG